MRWLLRLYPRAWRLRYQEEFLALLERRGVTPLDYLDILLGALDAHLLLGRERARRPLRALRRWFAPVRRPALAWSGMVAVLLLLAVTAAYILLVPAGRLSGAPVSTLIALAAAGVGTVLTVLYLGLGVLALRRLRGLSRQLNERGVEYPA